MPSGHPGPLRARRNIGSKPIKNDDTYTVLQQQQQRQQYLRTGRVFVLVPTGTEDSKQLLRTA